MALGAGIAGGADVILIPEIPYDIEAVAAAIRERSRTGSRFSIVAVSEGAMPKEHAKELERAESALAERPRRHELRLRRHVGRLVDRRSRSDCAAAAA